MYDAGGICDFTWKDQTTKENKFLYGDQATLVSHVTGLIDEVDKITHSRCPRSKFVICPTTGADVSHYIPAVASITPNLQAMIDNAVIDITFHILNINQGMSCRLP